MEYESIVMLYYRPLFQDEAINGLNGKQIPHDPRNTRLADHFQPVQPGGSGESMGSDHQMSKTFGHDGQSEVAKGSRSKRSSELGPELPTSFSSFAGKRMAPTGQMGDQLFDYYANLKRALPDTFSSFVGKRSSSGNDFRANFESFDGKRAQLPSTFSSFAGKRAQLPSTFSSFAGKRSAAELPDTFSGFTGKRSELPTSFSTFAGKRNALPSTFSSFAGKRSELPSTFSSFAGKRSELPSTFSSFAGKKRSGELPTSFSTFAGKRSNGLPSTFSTFAGKRSSAELPSTFSAFNGKRSPSSPHLSAPSSSPSPLSSSSSPPSTYRVMDHLPDSFTTFTGKRSSSSPWAKADKRNLLFPLLFDYPEQPGVSGQRMSLAKRDVIGGDDGERSADAMVQWFQTYLSSFHDQRNRGDRGSTRGLGPPLLPPSASKLSSLKNSLKNKPKTIFSGFASFYTPELPHFRTVHSSALVHLLPKRHLFVRKSTSPK